MTRASERRLGGRKLAGGIFVCALSVVPAYSAGGPPDSNLPFEASRSTPNSSPLAAQDIFEFEPALARPQGDPPSSLSPNWKEACVWVSGSGTSAGIPPGCYDFDNGSSPPPTYTRPPSTYTRPSPAPYQPSAADLARRQANELNDEGVALYNNKNYAGAIPKYRQALAIDPSNGTIRRNLANAQSGLLNQEGIALADRGDYAGAIAKYLQALAIDPSNGTIRRNLADARATPLNNEGVALAAAYCVVPGCPSVSGRPPGSAGVAVAV
jgi:hypothetical protein